MTKKLGLVDVDGHNFPNLALMKLSSWHKAHGDAIGAVRESMEKQLKN